MDHAAPVNSHISAPNQHGDISDPRKERLYVVVSVAICIASATPMVFTRAYAHFFVTRSPKWDDALVILSWFGFILFGTGMLLSVNYGTLYSIAGPTLDDLVHWRRLVWIMELVYGVSVSFAKMSVLVLYMRIFAPKQGGKTWVYWTIISFIIFNSLYYFSNLVAIGFSCLPRERIWDRSVPGHCINDYAVFIGTAALNIVSDLFMVIIPTSMIMQLQMPAKRKIEILLVFAFGIVCLVSAICRFIYGILGTKNPNRIHGLVHIALWALAEVTACLITACVPMVPSTINHWKRILNRLRTSSKPGSSTQVLTLPKKKKSVFGMTWLDTTLASRGDAEEDMEGLYHMGSSKISVRNGSETTRTLSEVNTPAADDKVDIVVSTTVEIASVPSSHFSADEVTISPMKPFRRYTIST